MVAFYDDFVTKAAEGAARSGRRSTRSPRGACGPAKRRWKGLVDKLGGFDVALAVAKERAKIAASQEVPLVVLPERKGLFETFMERQEEDPDEEAHLGAMLRQLPRDARALLEAALALQDRGPIARVPFELRFR